MARVRRILAAALAAAAVFLLAPLVLQPAPSHTHSGPSELPHPASVAAAALSTQPAAVEAALQYLDSKMRATALDLKRQILLHKGKDPAHSAMLPPTAGPDTALSVATMNAWGLTHEWPARLAIMAKILAELPVDFLGIQEVHRPTLGAPTQADELARETGMAHVAFHEVAHHESDPALSEGLALVSRLPIESSELIELPQPSGTSDMNPRALLHAVVATAIGRVHVFVAHLTYDARAQCSMAVAMMDAIAPRAGSEPIVLMGDFNTYFDFEWPMDLLTAALPPSLAVHALCPCAPVFAALPPDARQHWPPLTDAWEAVGEGPYGTTFTGFPENTEDPCRPDRILTRGLTPDTTIVLDPAVHGRVSDHRVVRATFRRPAT
eukprot:m.16781 g.16781  ORF g.16781 m.16781 type:complete len:380 (+) comp3176_c0_seq1:41-1180(+)